MDTAVYLETSPMGSGMYPGTSSTCFSVTTPTLAAPQSLGSLHSDTNRSLYQPYVTYRPSIGFTPPSANLGSLTTFHLNPSLQAYQAWARNYFANQQAQQLNQIDDLMQPSASGFSGYRLFPPPLTPPSPPPSHPSATATPPPTLEAMATINESPMSSPEDLSVKIDHH